ncbi:alpha/beta hydrolase family protein [Hymenobacter sp.]|jgi:dipeptidyl aminopeptidase/acylaminoacyl peptidase|uniref:alpha/beta hydrolase family protein n=1 Tax=Hymenobacter sp. TaxID=1898978 RepID=UPI002ED99475
MWHFFPENYMFSYQVQRALTQSLYGGGETNEVLNTASKIEVGNLESFHKEWLGQGRRSLAEANQALDENRTLSARAAFLRAANYLRTAEFFLLPTDARKFPTYQSSVAAFQKGAALLSTPPRRVEVPFEGAVLPGYYMPAPGAVGGPLMILFGGLDSTAEEFYFGPAQKLNERGISLLTLDGPGQGGALRLHHLHHRYDYEVAGTAALDWVLTNLDVDPARVGIMAVSMGGYMSARIAAFEPRFKVCAIWGAVYDYHEIWANRPDNHPLATILQHIVGVDNMQEAREKLSHYNLRGVAEKISMPTYIVHGEDDRQNPVSHAYRTFNDLTCPRILDVVPASSPGSAHCQIDGFTRTFPMFDWIQKNL